MACARASTIKFMVSLEEGDRFEARLVRVINGDCNPDGPGLKFAEIKHAANRSYKGKRQTIDAGSYMVAPTVPPLDRLTFTAYVWPTLPKRGFQVIAAQGGMKIALDEGALTLVCGGERHSLKAQDAGAPVVSHQGHVRCQIAEIHARTESRSNRIR